MRRGIPSALIALCLFLIVAVLYERPGRAQNSQAAPLLAGAIDIHVHSDPDNRPRSLDAIDAAKLARAAGMRAIVLKNHYDPTASLAYIVRKEVPGVEVFGGVDLNLTVAAERYSHAGFEV